MRAHRKRLPVGLFCVLVFSTIPFWMFGFSASLPQKHPKPASWTFSLGEVTFEFKGSGIWLYLARYGRNRREHHGARGCPRASLIATRNGGVPVLVLITLASAVLSVRFSVSFPKQNSASQNNKTQTRTHTPPRSQQRPRERGKERKGGSLNAKEAFPVKRHHHHHAVQEYLSVHLGFRRGAGGNERDGA